MTNHLATFGVMSLLVADYIGIIIWLMRTADVPPHTIRFSMRSVFLAMTFVAVHCGMFAAFLSELSPHNR
jgi:hypothetical protein